MLVPSAVVLWVYLLHELHPYAHGVQLRTRLCVFMVVRMRSHQCVALEQRVSVAPRALYPPRTPESHHQRSAVFSPPPRL